jgi:hypothetical protein
MLVFNFTTPHTGFDIKHDLKWMERKKKGKEMKNMSTSLSILQLHSILWPSWTGVCVFSVIKLWFYKVDEYLFLETQFRVKKEFFFKEN